MQRCQLTKQWLERKEVVRKGDNSLKKGKYCGCDKMGVLGWGLI